MEDKLVEILNLLEKDLKDIDSAVKHLSKSQEAAQALVDANMEFASQFREHMERLQGEIKNFLEALKADSDAIIEKWEQLSTGLSNMADRLGKLTTYFESVNFPARLDKFPARLDKIDTSIATLQQGILSNQTLLNDLFRKIDYNAKKIAEYHEQIIKQTRQVKVIALFILVIVLASIAISVAGVIPK